MESSRLESDVRSAITGLFQASRTGRGRVSPRAGLQECGSLMTRPDPTPYDGPDPYGNPDSEPAWMSETWSKHLKSIELDGAKVNYIDIGEGRPIVYVHGLSGCWQNWLENILPFSDTHRVIAVDLPGFGDSPMPEWEISMPRYGDMLDEFCRNLNLHACTLVGNSMGGFVAAEVAIREPDWVQELVLVSAAGISHAKMRKGPISAIGRVAVATTPLSLRIGDKMIMRPGLRRLAFRSVMFDPARLRPELLLEQYRQSLGAPGFFDALTSLTGYDFIDRLDLIRVPTLVIWGREDRIVPSADALGWQEHLSDSELIVFDKTGHVPMMERPVRFNATLANFLDSNG